MATTPPRPPIGQRRDFQGMERTRLRAARMFEHGTSQAESPDGFTPPARTPTGGIANGSAAAARPCGPCCTARSRTGSTATCGPASAW